MKTTLSQRTSYRRRSDFRVLEENQERFVIRTRRYGLLALGVLFIAAGLGLSSLAFTIATGDISAAIALASFSLLMALFGFAACWASVTQRDTITIDRQLGILQSKRARKRRRAGDSPFRVEEVTLAELKHVELRVRGDSAWLRFSLHDTSPIDVDHGTDVQQLESLGEKLASAAGSKLVHLQEPDA